MINFLGNSQASLSLEQSQSKSVAVSWEGYEVQVQHLAGMIQDSNWEFDKIVCIAKDGLLAGLCLSHFFDKELGVIYASSSKEGEISICAHIAIKSNTLGKRILLVGGLEDIVLSKVKEYILTTHKEVENIHTAALFSKEGSIFTPDYTAEYIDKALSIKQPFEKRMDNYLEVPESVISSLEKYQDKNILNVTWIGYDVLGHKLEKMIRDSNWQFDSVVCIARGGVALGLLLSHRFNKELGVICASSYEGENEMRRGELSVSANIAMKSNTLGKRVLLVDDLADSGITLEKIQKNVLSYEGVEEVRTAVLWTKTCSQFIPDYTAEMGDKKTWIYQPFERKLG